MVRVRSATTGERCTFWPPPLLWTLRRGATAARRVLHILSPLLAPATSLSIIFIVCSPLLPRSAPSPANAWLRTDCRLLPTSIFGEMCAAPTALVPIATSLSSTISYHWREPAAHAGAQTGPRQFVAKPRSLRTKTARTSPYALCLRASAPPVNVLYPQACLLICYSPTSYVFACPCDPTSRTTPSECVTIMRQPLPSLFIVSTKKRAQLTEPQKPAHLQCPPPRTFQATPSSFLPPQTFQALSTPTPSNFPRTFHAHIPPNFPRPRPKPSPPPPKLSTPFLFSIMPIPILSSAYSITYSLGYSMPMHDDSCHHSCHHSWSLHGVFMAPPPLPPLPPNFLIAPPPDIPKLA